MSGPTPSAPTVIDVPMLRARTIDALGSARRRNSIRYVIAVPAASPAATPVSRRPMNSTGSPFHAARSPAATIMVATAPSITPRRPTRAAMRGTASRAGDGAGREDGVDHRDHEGREVISDPVQAVEGARQGGEGHDDQ